MRPEKCEWEKGPFQVAYNWIAVNRQKGAMPDFLGLLLLVRLEHKNTHTLFAVSVLAPASSSSLTIKTCPFSTAWNNAVFLSWKENANSSCYKHENNISLFSFRVIRISQNSFLWKKTMSRNKTCQFSLEPRTRTWRQTTDVTNLCVSHNWQTSPEIDILRPLHQTPFLSEEYTSHSFD